MNYLMTKQAKIVAMTCTHAALKRREFLELGFQYDNLLMEESAQILEIETFIPMVLQVGSPAWSWGAQGSWGWGRGYRLPLSKAGALVNLLMSVTSQSMP